jgi:long-subunit fatty acid transport protein
LKLPTGSHSVRNGDGALAERSLQPGTGTTDLLLGAYTTHELPMKDLSWFAQATAQLPLNERDGYKPGSRFALDAGLRYDLNDQWSLMLQANALWRGRDSGVQSEPEDSGSTQVWIGPGASYAATRDLRIYAYLQVPIYQHVNGVQLVADKAGVIGVSLRF